MTTCCQICKKDAAGREEKIAAEKALRRSPVRGRSVMNGGAFNKIALLVMLLLLQSATIQIKYRMQEILKLAIPVGDLLHLMSIDLTSEVIGTGIMPS